MKIISTHGRGVWKNAAADKQKIVTVEMNVLRQLCRFSREQKKNRNERILEMMGIQHTIVDEIEK